MWKIVIEYLWVRVLKRGLYFGSAMETFVGMASGKESELEDAPAALYRSTVWDHFAFRVTYDDGSMKAIDKSATKARPANSSATR